MEGLREALELVEELTRENEKTEVVEICGHTYANKQLSRYDNKDKASPMEANSLTALVDYIRDCSAEFPEGIGMILHIENPKRVRLLSALDEERNRECLFVVNAIVNEFRFDAWYDQENFILDLQANFKETDDLVLLEKVAGNVERKNGQSYADDGVSQVATMTVGVATKQDVIVPNPVTLVPYRTFQEVEQPESTFVFRMADKEVPAFKLVEAQGGIWKNQAVSNIKRYLADALSAMPDEIKSRIIIIG